MGCRTSRRGGLEDWIISPLVTVQRVGSGCTIAADTAGATNLHMPARRRSWRGARFQFNQLCCGPAWECCILDANSGEIRTCDFHIFHCFQPLERILGTILDSTISAWTHSSM